MVVTFNAADLRDAMNICATNLKPVKIRGAADLASSRPGLECVELKCHWDHCLAGGTNGYGAGIIRILCTMSEPSEPVTLHLLPLKIPGWATRVSVIDDPESSDLEIRFESGDAKPETVRQSKKDVIPLDYERIEKTYAEDVDDDKWVVVNRKLLIQALESLKGEEKVVIHLGKTVIKPVTIQPYKSEYLYDAKAIVLPTRP